MLEVKFVSCPNCYLSQVWNEKLEDIACKNCGRLIPVVSMAQALIHLFCAPTRNNVDAKEGYELLTWLDDTGWGDALRIGRHDWVLADCPLTVPNFCHCIRHSDELGLMAVSRLLSQNEIPDFLKDSRNKLAEATIWRLERESNEHCPERLYYILNNFPDNRFLSDLEQIAAKYPSADGDPDTHLGRIYEQALESCRKA